ncbi:MAG: hypothetical protein ACLT1J_10290 [Mediterraneibacter gnavus]
MENEEHLELVERFAKKLAEVVRWRSMTERQLIEDHIPELAEIVGEARKLTPARV